MAAQRPRGFNLVKQVYAELSATLGDEYSASDLLRAAQVLVETTREEGEADWDQVDWHRHSNYYSAPVDEMLINRHWFILMNEKCDSDEHLYERREAEIYEYYRELHHILKPKWYRMGNIFD